MPNLIVAIAMHKSCIHSVNRIGHVEASQEEWANCVPKTGNVLSLDNKNSSVSLQVEESSDSNKESINLLISDVQYIEEIICQGGGDFLTLPRGKAGG